MKLPQPHSIGLACGLLATILAGKLSAQTPPALQAQPRSQPAPQAAIASVESVVETGDELHFIRPAELKAGKPLTLVLRNKGKRPVKAQLSLGVKERANAPAELQSGGEVTIPPGSEVRVPLSAALVGPRLGIKYVDWQLAHDGQTVSGHAAFALFDPVGVTPGVSPGFVFGNAGMRNYWDPALKERIVRTATIVGAESLRGDADWLGVQPTADDWKWERTDETIALLERYGAQMQNLVAYGGREWTKSDETLRLIRERGDDKLQWRYPPRLDAWRPWVRAQAERYKGRIRFYEIWNEPDISFWKGTPDQYLEVLQAAHEEIKAADPDAQVLTGGFASMDHREHNHRLVELTLRDGQPYFDLHAYHRHGSFAMLQTEVDGKLIPLREKLGVKEPLYFNETAMRRDYEREYEQAIELPKRLAFVWSRGAKGYHYFNVWNRKEESSSARGYNMVNWDFTPRPVWVAYNEMSRALRGREFSHELKLGAGRWGFAFQGKGDFSGRGASDYALVAWTEDAVLADAPTVLNVGGGASARVLDLMGNSTPVPVSEGRLVFTVRHEPQYLLIENAGTKPQPEGALLMAERAGAVVPGGPGTVKVRLSNPLGTAQTARLMWTVPPPLIARSQASIEKTLPPKGEVEATLEIALPPDAKSAGAAPLAVTAAYQVGASELRAEASIPVSLGVKIPRGESAHRPPDFSLQKAGDVVNTNDIDPATNHLTWKGPPDLSAKAWLGSSADALTLRFSVRDDTHRQPHAGKELGHGDSVLVALAVPGQDGSFEFSVARRDNGRPGVHSHRAPRGFKGGAVATAIDLQTGREGDVTIYEVGLAQEAFGLSPEKLAGGVGFSFRVNDLDEPGQTMREGYLRLCEGLGDPSDASRFPIVVIE